jgi:hypothetical protein
MAIDFETLSAYLGSWKGVLQDSRYKHQVAIQIRTGEQDISMSQLVPVVGQLQDEPCLSGEITILTKA